MIQRFATGIFTQEYKKTIGVDFLEKSITMGGLELRLMLWDTAGQEEFHSITRIVIITETKCQVNHCIWSKYISYSFYFKIMKTPKELIIEGPKDALSFIVVLIRIHFQLWIHGNTE